MGTKSSFCEIFVIFVVLNQLQYEEVLAINPCIN